jgi:PAS domain S-box-containing protein
MKDQEKTKAELVNELKEMRQRVAELEASQVALKHREEADQEAQATCGAMVEAFDGFIYVCSSNYEVEFMNERFVRRTGHSPIGEKCYRALHDREEICPWCVNERVQRGETVRWENRSPKDRRWYYIVNTPVRHRDGTISKMAMIQDITERKRAENVLLARFRLVQYAAAHSLDELLQATLDEVEVLTDSSIGFYHFVEPDQKTLCLQAWSTRTLRELCTAEGKGSHYDIDEADVWVECVHERRPVIHNDYSALPDRKGMPPGHAEVIRELVVPVFRGDRIVAIVGVGNKPLDYDESDIETVSLVADLAWDIAERKKAEEALRESQERLELAMEGAELGMWDWNIQTGKLVFNRRWAEMLGYSPDEIRPYIDSWEESIHAEDAERVKEVLNRHVAGETPSYVMEYRIRTKSGGQRWVLARGKVVRRDNEGRPLRATGTRLDITDRKRTEELLRDRTEALELSNRDLEQFAYVAAHDLREPLVAVSAYLKLLERRCAKSLDEDVQKFLSRALQTTLRMDALIQSLLAYSRMGKGDWSFEATDCNVVLKNALSNLHASVKESGATVTSDALPVVMANPPQVLQLFQNLLSNAIKFRGDKPLKILLGCSQGNGENQFFVKDNGIGIEPPNFDRIFLIFQRLQTGSDSPGTGIGLANCRKIVERHGGRIWVESEPGVGSTFFFTIPERPTES